MRSVFALKAITCAVAVLMSQQAAASGYHFDTQSVSSQSTANAATAEAADASTLFYNAAGLAELDGHQISGSLNWVAPTIKYSDAKAEHFDAAKTPVKGSTSGKISPNSVVAPHIYGAYKLNERVTLGLGMYVPFASATEYAKDSVLRYNMNQLSLTSVAIEPAVAFKINAQHAIGAGVVAQYSAAEWRKFEDWGLRVIPKGPGHRVPGGLDGYAQVKGDDLGFGYHLSYLFKSANDRFRIGVNYRSEVKHNLEGTAEWKAINPANEAYRDIVKNTIDYKGMGFVPKEDASVKIVTPESLSVHGMFRANDKINVFGDVTWTRHSRFKEATLYFANEKKLDNLIDKTANSTTLTPNWRNTFKASLGASYQLNEKWQLRGGVAFDQSPVRNAKDRLATLPDGNRVWFSAGVKYAPNKNHVFDLAYTHIHIQDTSVHTAAATGKDVDNKGSSSAKFKNHANIVGLQYTYKF